MLHSAAEVETLIIHHMVNECFNMSDSGSKCSLSRISFCTFFGLYVPFALVTPAVA